MDRVRLEHGSRLYKVANQALAAELEAMCFVSAGTVGHLHGIPAWSYANGQTLFATSRPEVHSRAWMSSYLGLVQKAEVMMAHKAMRHKLEEHASYFLQASDAELEAMSEYGRWKDAYLQELTRSKQVLQERETETGEFIQCNRCKSHAVDTEQKQTRSADEPMTLFCMCRKCGLRFTMH